MVPDTELVQMPLEAVWIGSDHPFDLHEVYLRFRSPRAWWLDKVPKLAELLISADSRYKLWINGRFVARGPARSYPDSQTVDRLDVTEHMQSSTNTLAVQVYQPGYSHFSYVHRGSAGLLACVFCDSKISLASDTNWHVSPDESFSSAAGRVSIYGSGVEERNLNKAEEWMEAAYDDIDWPMARLVTTVGGWPWTSLRARQLPLLEERELLATLIKTGKGSIAELEETDPHQALRSGYSTAESFDLKSRSREWFAPKLASNEGAYWLYDLGRDYTFQGWAEIEAANGQEQLYISYAEKMSQGQIILSDPKTYCRMRMTDRFLLQRGKQVAEPFSLRGGRYLLWQLVGPTGDNFRFRPHIRVAEYPLTISRKVSTSDRSLSQIIQICETTIHACLQDGFVDCVWRESAQWLGDALPQSLTLWSMADDIRPLQQIIEMAAQGIYPDGILPLVAGVH